jgi:hypothetical protein
MMRKSDVKELLGCSNRTIERYVKSGKLTQMGKGKSVKFDKNEVLKIASKLLENKAKHRPDSVKPDATIILPDPRQARKLIADEPTEELLNSVGKEVILETTALLESNDLLEGVDRTTILRYALAVQLKDKYINAGALESDKYFFDIAKQFQAEIQHYEKELGLTPAALAKIKPREKESSSAEVDPMSEFV